MKLSVITPVYNRADCILRCLNSVSDQTDAGIEIEHIVVDDGSTDDTLGIVKRYADTHSHVKAIIFDKNRGTNAARNAAILAATGDYCVLLDSDDFFLPDAVKIITETMEAHKGYGCYLFQIEYRKSEFNDILDFGDVKEYTYDDVMRGAFSGDFVHVVASDVMRKFMFDEKLRIYEGLIIRQYYRCVGKMLFVNRPTTFVELNRTDSVSLTTIRISEPIIRTRLDAKLAEYRLFGDDLISLGERDKFDALIFQICDNALLLGDYDLAASYVEKMSGGLKKSFIRILRVTRLAKPYRWALKTYLKLKYRKKLS